MANFLEDFIAANASIADNVVPDPDSPVGQFLDNIWPDANNVPGLIATAPLQVPAAALRAGVTGLAIADDALSRPFSTALQAINAANPLYRDGLQWQDFADMWQASAYVSPGRAGVTNIGSSIGMIETIMRGGQRPDSGGASWNEFSYGSGYNPYNMTPEELEAKWDNSPLGTIGSLSLDIGWQFGVGKGIGAGASFVKRAGGLATNINGVRDLKKIDNTLTDAIKYAETGGAEGAQSFWGDALYRLVNAKTADEVYENPWVNATTRTGSTRQLVLSSLLTRVDDPYLVKDILLADRGDMAALGRLFQTAPDVVWNLSDMNSVLRSQMAVGGQWHPDPSQANLIRQTFYSATERDEFYRELRDIFLQQPDDLLKQADELDSRALALRESGDLGEAQRLEVEAMSKRNLAAMGENGKLDIAGIGADFVPMQGVAGRAQRYFYNAVLSAQTGAPNRFVDMTLGPLGMAAPVTTLLQWVGGRKPLNRVSLSGLRPTEAVDEMLAYSASSRVLRGNKLVDMPVTRADGSVGIRTLKMSQWRTEAIARLADAKARGGDTAVAQTIRELESELVAAIGNRYGIDSDTVRRVTQGLQEARDKAQTDVARDGFFYDDAQGLVIVDPVTRRQLADELVLLPLDQIDFALRVESTTSFAKRGRGIERAKNLAEPAADFVLRFFRTNMLFRPGYVPKNAIGEPAIASLIAHGTIVSPDGLMPAVKNFFTNRARQVKSLGYWFADRSGASGLRRSADEIRDLHMRRMQIKQMLDDEEVFIQTLDSGGMSPASRVAYMNQAVDSRKALDKELREIERVLDDFDSEWREVRELPSYAQLSQRIADIEDVANASDDWVSTIRARIDEINQTADSRTVSSVEDLDRRIAGLRAQLDDLRRADDQLEDSWQVDRTVATTRGEATRGQRLEAIEQELAALRQRRQDARARAAAATDEAEQLRLQGEVRSLQRRIKTLARRRAAARNRDEFNNPVTMGGEAADVTARRSTARGRDYQGVATERQIRSLQKQIDELEDRRVSLVEDASEYRPSILTAAEQSEVRSLERLLNLREKYVQGDIDLDSTLTKLKQDLALIREEMRTAEPTALVRKTALEEELAKLDRTIGEKNTSLNARRRKREKARRRNLGGEANLAVDTQDGRSIEVRGLYNEDVFGAAYRSEVSSGRTNIVTFDPGEYGGAASARWARYGGVGVVQPTDPQYWDELAYIANRQIRGDQFGVLVLRGASTQEIISWLRTPGGRKYARSMGWDNDSMYSQIVNARRIKQQYQERTPRQRSDISAPGEPANRPGYQANVTAAEARVQQRTEDLRAARASGDGIEDAEEALRSARYELQRLRLASGNSGAPVVERGPGNFRSGADAPTPSDPKLPVTVEAAVARNVRVINQYFPDAEVRARLLEGGDVTPQELQALMGLRDDLSPVHSGELVYSGLGEANRAINNSLEAIWRNLAIKPEDRFGRFPFMDRQWRTNIQRDARLLEAQGVKLTADRVNALRSTAATRALKEAEQVFYNIRRYSNPVFALRYLVGFPGAYFNSLYRYTRLAYRNPGRAYLGANAYTGTYETFGIDENGDPTDDWTKVTNLVFSVPDSVRKVIPTDPTVSLSTRSVDYITEAPTFLPFATVPVASLLRYKPQSNEWIKETFGPQVYEALFPFGQPTFDNQITAGPIVLDPLFAGWELDLITAVNPTDEDFIQAADQLFAYNMAEYERNGEVGPAPTPEQAAQQARQFWFGRSFLKFMGLGGLGAQPAGEMMRQEWYKLREQYPNDTAAARAKFVEMHGEWAEYYTFSTSEYRAYIPATNKAADRLQEFGSLANELRQINPDDPDLVSIMFWGTDGEFDRAVYNYYADATLPGDDIPIRGKLDPEELRDRDMAFRSWEAYNKAVATRDATMMQYGYGRLSPTGESAWLHKQWNEWLDGFIADPKNAQWYAQFSGANRGRVTQTLNALNRLFDNEDFMRIAGDHNAYRIARKYLDNFEIAQDAYRKASSSEARASLQLQWDEWVSINLLPGSSEFSSLYVRNLQGKDLG